MNGIRVNNTAASASAIASMGGYGCKKYNVPGGDAEEFKADGIGTFVSVIQAFEDTEILPLPFPLRTSNSAFLSWLTALVPLDNTC